MKRSQLYGAGVNRTLLKPQYNTPRVFQWMQKHHSNGRKLISPDGYYRSRNHQWQVPYGVRDALTQPLTVSQIAMKYPFYVTWVSPKTHRRLKKYFMSLPSSIIFVAHKAQYVDPDASIVSRHGFFIPRNLMGKFPRRYHGKLHYWCPRCMCPRRFRRMVPSETFYAMKKVWSETRHRYEFTNRELVLLECSVCGITNRTHVFRRCNQPVTKVKLKPSARRMKRKR